MFMCVCGNYRSSFNNFLCSDMEKRSELSSVVVFVVVAVCGNAPQTSNIAYVCDLYSVVCASVLFHFKRFQNTHTHSEHYPNIHIMRMAFIYIYHI